MRLEKARLASAPNGASASRLRIFAIREIEQDASDREMDELASGFEAPTIPQL